MGKLKEKRGTEVKAMLDAQYQQHLNVKMGVNASTQSKLENPAAVDLTIEKGNR